MRIKLLLASILAAALILGCSSTKKQDKDNETQAPAGTITGVYLGTLTAECPDKGLTDMNVIIVLDKGKVSVTDIDPQSNSVEHFFQGDTNGDFSGTIKDFGKKDSPLYTIKMVEDNTTGTYNASIASADNACKASGVIYPDIVITPSDPECALVNYEDAYFNMATETVTATNPELLNKTSEKTLRFLQKKCNAGATIVEKGTENEKIYTGIICSAGEGNTGSLLINNDSYKDGFEFAVLNFKEQVAGFVTIKKQPEGFTYQVDYSALSPIEQSKEKN